MIKASGYLIAGGESRRMGRDKRSFMIDGKPLLDVSIEKLAGAVGDGVSVVGDDLEGLVPDSVRILKDAVPRMGPLGGLVTALEDSLSEQVLILGVDLPLLTVSDLKSLLAAAETSDSQVLSLSRGGQLEPLAALYRKSQTAFWRDRLAQRKLALQEGIRHLGWQAVEPVSGEDALLNVNRREDWSRVLEILNQPHRGGTGRHNH